MSPCIWNEEQKLEVFLITELNLRNKVWQELKKSEVSVTTEEEEQEGKKRKNKEDTS